MNTVMTIDGEKTSEFVFDNTQAKKHIKFFWAPDAFTKDYLFTDEWEYPAGGCKWTTDLKRGGVSIWNWVGDYSFVNNANKFEFKTMDKIVQTPMSPLYGLDHFYVGKYYKNGERTRTVTYEKQNRNFLLGKLFVEDKLVLDGERGPGPSPTKSRTGTSSLESSLLRTNLCWMVRDSATSSLTPGPPLTP